MDASSQFSVSSVEHVDVKLKMAAISGGLSAPMKTGIPR